MQIKFDPWPLSRFERISKACGLLAVTIGVFALMGWFTGSVALKGIRPDYIPMAPNTALVFILLGFVLVGLNSEKRRAVVGARVATLLSLLLVGTRLGEYLIDIHGQVDHLFLSFPAETLGLAPIGKMAFYTAATFFLLSLAFFFCTFPSRWTNNFTKGLSLVVAFIGAVFSLGYVYGAPLMYGRASIPMALNTAVCFVVLGSGLLVKSAIRDVAERRQAKEALQKAHDELEMRVNERTAELTRVVASLEAEVFERTQAQKALQETEEQLLQAQKLEAVGRLAGGVAHDFNNLLTVIMGYSDLLLMKPNLDDRTNEKIQEIKTAADRASALTRQLLAFSRKQVMKPEILDMNVLVHGILKMLGRLIGEDVELIASLDPNVGKVKADPGQIEQVLTNLVVNARDAMPNGGKITIETANVQLDKAYAGMHIAVVPGDYVMLAVSDIGCGMDEETRKHIFEPFFTTKEVGKGTGLGLSMIYGIVKQSGGNIWVYSEPGRGTSFKIYLPLVVAEIREDATKIAGRKTLPGQASGTILLAEDEAMVRNLARDILEGQGYRVLVAQNGEEAIAICRAETQRIDLMLTDVVMPKMNGQELAQTVRGLRPKMQILFMSGYTDEAIIHHGVLEPGTVLLEKPFTAEELVSKVREVLSNAEQEIPVLTQR
ncbi:MAG TPA: ATP-binding protein [Pyrinomonadaceae bacterium]|nr:ATP-binding protein [Pyrinomonadaceae bacterium]